MLLENGRLLRIEQLNHDLDSGLYQCNGTSLMGEGHHAAAAIVLSVKASAPQFRMPSQRVWKVLLGAVVELNCDVDAAPPSLIRWVDANDSAIQLVPGKIEVRRDEPNSKTKVHLTLGSYPRLPHSYISLIQIKLFPNYSLRIYDLTSADEGYYYCNVSNKYGINRALNKIEVFSASLSH